MKQPLQEGISIALAALARLLTPALARQLSRLSLLIVVGVPRLGATWTARYREPTRQGGVRQGKVDLVFNQFGSRVWGIGHIEGEPGDPFEFRGQIKWNVFYGTFSRRDTHILAGTGTFVLKIAADTQSMTGSCA